MAFEAEDEKDKCFRVATDALGIQWAFPVEDSTPNLCYVAKEFLKYENPLLTAAAVLSLLEGRIDNSRY